MSEIRDKVRKKLVKKIEDWLRYIYGDTIIIFRDDDRSIIDDVVDDILDPKLFPEIAIVDREAKLPKVKVRRLYHILRVLFCCPFGFHRWRDSLPPHYEEWCIDCPKRRKRGASQ